MPDHYDVTQEQDEPTRNLVKFVYDMLEKSAQWKYLYAGNQHSKWINDIKFYKKWKKN